MKTYIVPVTESHELETSSVIMLSLNEEVGTGGQLTNTDVFDEEDDRPVTSKGLWDN